MFISHSLFFLPVRSRALAGERHLAIPGGIHFLAESEIGNLDLAFAVKQNIRRLQIVMNDPRVARAHVLQSRQHLDHDPARLRFFQGSVLLEILFQVGSGTIFENGSEGIAVDDKAIELTNHVFVADSLHGGEKGKKRKQKIDGECGELSFIHSINHSFIHTKQGTDE